MQGVGEILKSPAGKAATIAAAEGVFLLLDTVSYPHRQLTHDSIRLHNGAERAALMGMWLVGVNVGVWASVHTIHHSNTDVNLVPALETADYLEWRKSRQDIDHPPVPALFTGLDPVAQLTAEQVIEIGNAARQQVKGKYKVPEGYDQSTAERLLDPNSARFYYPNVRKLAGKRSKDIKFQQEHPGDIWRIAPRLRDAHSSALHPEGMWGNFRDNVPLYMYHGSFFEDIDNRPTHLREVTELSWDKGEKEGLKFFIVGNIIVGALINKETPRNLPAGAILGGLAAYGAGMILQKGGDATNTWGHAGATRWRDFIRNPKAPPLVKPDGTYESNSRSLSLLTMDEVGGQEPHHKWPWNIAYTDKTGVNKIIDAPIGSVFEEMAKRGVLMDVGNNFGLEPGEEALRPDMPTEATLLMQSFRRQTLRSAA